MNRDLTINLKINSASSDNARTVSETIRGISENAKAATAATTGLSQAQQAAANTAQAAAASARNVGASIVSISDASRTATASTREYGSSLTSLDEKISSLEREIASFNQQLDESEQAQRRVIAADRQYLEGVNKVISGVTSLARSVVLMVAANEDQASSMLKIIARFESVAQAVKGVISIIQGVTKAWQAYTAAAAAASVASRFTFSGAGGAAGRAVIGGAGGGAMAAGAGALAAGGVSAAAAGGLTGAYLGGQFGVYPMGAAGLTTAMLDLGILPAAAVGTVGAFGGFGLMQGIHRLFGIGEGDGFVNQGFGTAQRFESIPSLIGSTLDARSSAAATGQQLARQQAEFALKQQQLARDSSREVMQLRQSQASFGVDLDQSLFAAGFQDPTRTVRWNDSFERARRLNTTQMGMLLDRQSSTDLQIRETSIERRGDQNVIVRGDSEEAKNEKLRQQSEIQRELLKLQQERLSISQQEAETAVRMTEALQGSLAQMSGGDARKLASAIRKADSGELLNEREIGLLRQNRIAGYDEQIARSQQSIIDRDENKQFIQRNQAEKTQVNELVANVKVQSEAVLKLQAEVDAKAPEWTSQIVKFVADHVEKLKQQLNEQIRQQWETEARRLDQSNAARDNNSGASNPYSGP